MENRNNQTPAELAKPPLQKRKQVEDGLRALVATLAPGDRIPSIPELGRHFGVAAGTAQAAVDTLSREGLILRRAGAGTFVAPSRVVLPDAPAARPQTLAVVDLDINPFSQHLLKLVKSEAEQAGFSVVCRYVDYQSPVEDALHLQALEPSGYLLLTYGLSETARVLRAQGQRVVVLGETPAFATPVAPVVSGDAEQGGYLVAKYLLERGHRRLAYTYFDDNIARLKQSWRWQGHLRALGEFGVAADHPILFPWHNGRYGYDIEALRALFQGQDAPTGVLVWSDGDALAFMTALRKIGVRVPEDVSIIAYDNLPVGEDAEPGLDTVDQHLATQIRHALGLLESPDTDPAVSMRLLVSPTIVSRASTRAV